jgi:hypothetical protein
MGMVANKGRLCELTRPTVRVVAHETASCYNPGANLRATSTEVDQDGEILSTPHYLGYIFVYKHLDLKTWVSPLWCVCFHWWGGTCSLRYGRRGIQPATACHRT